MAIEWEWLKAYSQIDRNLQDLYKYKKILKHFSRVWAWQFCAVSGR